MATGSFSNTAQGIRIAIRTGLAFVPPLPVKTTAKTR